MRILYTGKYCYIALRGPSTKKITKTTKMYTPGFVNTFDRLLLLYQVCFQTVRLHYICSLKYKYTRTLQKLSCMFEWDCYWHQIREVEIVRFLSGY